MAPATIITTFCLALPPPAKIVRAAPPPLPSLPLLLYTQHCCWQWHLCRHQLRVSNRARPPPPPHYALPVPRSLTGVPAPTAPFSNNNTHHHPIRGGPFPYLPRRSVEPFKPTPGADREARPTREGHHGKDYLALSVGMVAVVGAVATGAAVSVNRACNASVRCPSSGCRCWGRRCHICGNSIYSVSTSACQLPRTRRLRAVNWIGPVGPIRRVVHGRPSADRPATLPRLVSGASTGMLVHVARPATGE